MKIQKKLVQQKKNLMSKINLTFILLFLLYSCQNKTDKIKSETIFICKARILKLNNSNNINKIEFFKIENGQFYKELGFKEIQDNTIWVDSLFLNKTKQNFNSFIKNNLLSRIEVEYKNGYSEFIDINVDSINLKDTIHFKVSIE